MQVYSHGATWLTFCLVVLGFLGATQIDGVSSRMKSAFGFPILRRHLMAVEPENRLVAKTFEDEWNEKLEQLEQAQAEYEQRRAKSQYVLDAHTRSALGNRPRAG